jgi:hypothetical protein
MGDGRNRESITTGAVQSGALRQPKLFYGGHTRTELIPDCEPAGSWTRYLIAICLCFRHLRSN